ncbi:synaptic vesicle 2-related protein-like [Glandiceps talaboti]
MEATLLVGKYEQVDGDQARSRRNINLVSYGTQSEELTYTVEDAITGIGFGKFQVFVLSFLMLTMVAYAFQIVIVAAVTSTLQCELNLTNLQVTVLTADHLLQAQWLVKRRIHMEDGHVLVTLAPTYTWLIIFRFMIGFYVSGMVTSFPYVAEFIPTKIRGTILLIFWSAYSVGTVVQSFADYLIIPTLGWRWLVVISTTPFIIFVLGSYFLPESPRYLLVSGDQAKATRILEEIAKTNGGTLPPGRLVPPKDIVRRCIPVSIAVDYKFGRRLSSAILSILSAIFYFLLAICVNRMYFVVISFFARCLIGAAFDIMITYAAEFYPTTLRGTGLLVCYSVGRIGSLITPFVGQLLMAFSPVSAICIYGGSCIILAVLNLSLPFDTTDRPLSLFLCLDLFLRVYLPHRFYLFSLPGEHPITTRITT